MKDAVGYLMSHIIWIIALCLILFVYSIGATVYHYANFVTTSKQVISREGGVTVQAQIAMNKVSDGRFVVIPVDKNQGYRAAETKIHDVTIYKTTGNVVDYGDNIYYYVQYGLWTPFGRVVFPVSKQVVQSDVRNPGQVDSAKFYVTKTGVYVAANDGDITPNSKVKTLNVVDGKGNTIRQYYYIASTAGFLQKDLDLLLKRIAAYADSNDYVYVGLKPVKDGNVAIVLKHLGQFKTTYNGKTYDLVVSDDGKTIDKLAAVLGHAVGPNLSFSVSGRAITIGEGKNTTTTAKMGDDDGYRERGDDDSSPYTTGRGLQSFITSNVIGSNDNLREGLAKRIAPGIFNGNIMAH